MKELLNSLAAKLPFQPQRCLERRHFARAVRRGTFTADESEHCALATRRAAGDWALDVGANVGH